MTCSDHYDQQFKFLRRFFDSAKNSSMLYLADDILRQARLRIRNALNELLIWGRPYLLNTCGIQWPYDELIRIAPDLEEYYLESTDKSAQKQALLFLALLPVPNQWRWLSKAIDTLADEPEINNFLFAERKIIQAKIRKKSQDIFELRNFIQILKSPHLPLEKGVIRIFSLPYLLLDKQVLKKLSKHYLFYVEPPMGVIFRHSYWHVFTEQEDPCIFGLGGEEDRRFVAMQSNAYPVPLAHGDFLPDVGSPNPSVIKDIDIVFNATFDDMPRKRHVFMLKLLNDKRLLSKKALFLGRGSRRSVEIFEKQVARLGLTDRVTVLSNVRRQDLPSYLDRCKVGVHLSLYENTCRCVYEYFRADIPCVLSAATAGMNMMIFNHQTGHVGQDDQLAEIIANMLNNLQSYSPREWFLNNSGSQHSSRKLNEKLKDLSIEKGYQWQNNIVQLGSSGTTRYLEKDHYHQFLPEYKQLLAWLKPSITSIELTVKER